MKRIISGILAILLLVSMGISFSPVSSADAASEWSAINKIYYSPSQEDANNNFLQTAANELKLFLGNVGRNLDIVTGSIPSEGAIFLSVNASLPQLAGMSYESFHIFVNEAGIHITGKTPLAVRHGAYYLLDECLGFRWFFPTDTWTVKPDTLPEPGTITETVQEPKFFARQLYFGTTVVRNWNKRNRMWGAYQYQTGEIYKAVLEYATNWSKLTDQQKRAFYLKDTTVFLPADNWTADPNGYPKYPWQLNPYNSTVQEMTANLTNYRLSWAPLLVFDTGDKLSYGAMSVTPNDGIGWGPPYNASTVPPNDSQNITDAVYTLANHVAENISATFSDRYVALLGYTLYGCVPSFELEPNIIATITTEYNYTPLTTVEQITGLYQKGIKLGIYDYPDFVNWYKDKPVRNWYSPTILSYLYSTFGLDFYNSEAYGTAWGAKGPTYYAISKLLWDPGRNFNEIMLDFYEKAFGPAKGIMQRYYETAGVDLNGKVFSGNAALRFRLLAQAEQLARGHNDIIARIRELQYYERFLWKFWLEGVYGDGNAAIGNLEGLNQTELENLYRLITRMDSLYLLNTKYFTDTSNSTPGLVTSALKNRFSAIYPNFQAVGSALADFNPPTAEQAANWLAEALFALNGYSDADVFFDPFYFPITFGCAGNTTSLAAAAPSATQSTNTYMIPCEAGENITVSLKGTFSTESVVWQNPYGLNDTKITPGNLSNWTDFYFTASVAGNWKLTIGNLAGTHFVNFPNRKASKVLYPEGFGSLWLSSQTGIGSKWYFYVPSRTGSFRIGLTCPAGKTVTGTITGSDNGTTAINITQDTQFTFSSPAAGIWSIDLPPQNHNTVKLNIHGIQPLVWHDPHYLPIPVDNTVSLTSININPGDQEITSGRTVQYYATGVYTDNSTEDITPAVSWSSGNEGIATINAESGSALAISGGQCFISAEFGGITGNTTLNVLTSVEINSGEPVFFSNNSSRENIPLSIRGIPVTTGNTVGSFTFSLTWNPDVFRVDNITGAILPGFDILTGIPDNVTGSVSVNGSASGTNLAADTVIAHLDITAMGIAENSTVLSTSVISLADNTSTEILPRTTLNMPVTVTDKMAETSLSLGLDSSGVVVVQVRVDRIKNLSDNNTVALNGGMRGYSARIILPGAGMEVLGVQGVAPYDSVAYNPVTGSFSVANTSSPVQPANTLVAEIVVKLTGNNADYHQLSILFNSIFAAADGTGAPGDGMKTMTFRRGDANGDGMVDIGDALIIAQYIVKQKPLAAIKALNSAGISHEISGGDRIGIGDALFIAQYIVGQKNSWFE